MFAPRRRRRRRQVAPASYTASHVDNEKETLGFHNFYAWFSSVSPISIGMRLRSPAFRAGEAPLKNADSHIFPLGYLTTLSPA